MNSTPCYPMLCTRSYACDKHKVFYAEGDAVNPTHYKRHPSGVECIDIVRHMNFNLGNAMKYIWRAGLKTSSPIEDLKKAKWYLEDEITALEKSDATRLKE